MPKNRFITLDIDFRAIDRLGKGLKGYRRMLAGELKKALTATVLDIEAEAKRRCPVDTGRLRASITPDIRSPTEGFVGTNVEYAAAVEYGSRPHEIRPRNGKALKFSVGGTKGGYVSTKTGKKRWQKGKEGNAVFAKKVNHPGTKAQPFLEPAYVKGTEVAQKHFNAAMKRLMSKLERMAR
jgi:Bacteriophage HK97-gp10, putative tail-component